MPKTTRKAMAILKALPQVRSMEGWEAALLAGGAGGAGGGVNHRRKGPIMGWILTRKPKERKGMDMGKLSRSEA